ERRDRGSVEVVIKAKAVDDLYIRILTISFAFLVSAGVTWAFVDNIPLATDEHRVLAFGVYGAFLAVHLIVQSLFAFLEHRKMRKGDQVCSYSRTVALTISAFQEDPGYLRESLSPGHPRTREGFGVQ
uniref:Uncharacterized protein n=1 Tax=Leptobrachium leishanense TaxID=445787 RepID=A0A8C5Q8D2_9ANUR